MSLSSRTIFLVGFLFCLFMLSIAGYFQLIEHVKSCLLCILQRISILILGLIFLIATLHNPRASSIRVYGGLIALFAFIGGSISALHVRLQNLYADHDFSCNISLNFMLDNFPLTKALTMVLRSFGECTEILWTFLGLSMPAWTLIAFLILVSVGIAQTTKRRAKGPTWI